jgi:hypothetical protein
LRAALARTLEVFSSARVFREGAENCARGGRAPVPVFRFNLHAGFILRRAAGFCRSFSR